MGLWVEWSFVGLRLDDRSERNETLQQMATRWRCERRQPRAFRERPQSDARLYSTGPRQPEVDAALRLEGGGFEARYVENGAPYAGHECFVMAPALKRLGRLVSPDDLDPPIRDPIATLPALERLCF